MKETHYNTPGREECFVEMELIFGRQALISFCELNAYKYEYRADHKNQKQEDHKKQDFYDLLAKKLRNNNHKEIKEILKHLRKYMWCSDVLDYFPKIAKEKKGYLKCFFPKRYYQVPEKNIKKINGCSITIIKAKWLYIAILGLNANKIYDIKNHRTLKFGSIIASEKLITLIRGLLKYHIKDFLELN